MGLFGRIGGGLGSAFGSIFGRGGSAAFSPPTRGELVGLFGNPRPANLTQDSIASEIFVAPYRGPGDLDRYGRETPEMRNRYRTQYLAEPVVKAAVQGKVSAVSILEVSVLPADRRNPIDRGIAEFVHWTIARARGGWHGLIRSILTAGVIDGWSLCEKKLGEVRYKGTPLWGLDHVRNLDTAIMRLELDIYRNVTSIVNMVRGIEYYSPDQVLLYTHNPLYSNPFGHSDLRAATRAANIIEDVYKLWYVLLNRFGTPYFHGKAKDPAQRKMMEATLAALRAGGWAVTGVEDEILVLDLAVGAGSGAFKDIVQTMREDVLFAIRGAALPFLEGDGGNSAHGDTNTQKVATDVTEEMLALDAMEVINHQLIPWLVKPNWGERVDMPTAVIGMTNVGEMLQVAQMVKAYQDTGLALSKEWVYQLAKAPPPDDPEDELKAPEPPQPPGGPGLPGLNGHPAALPPHPGTPAPSEASSFAAGKAVPAAEFSDGPPRPGLVPKSGDPAHPQRWLRPETATAHDPDPERSSAPHDAADPGGTHTLADLARDFPDAAADAKTWAAVRSAVGRVRSAVYGWAVRQTPAVWEALHGVLDSSEDMARFGFAPGGTNPKGDAIQSATGVSTHLAIKIASNVLSRAWVFAKGKAGKTMSDAPAVDVAAALVELFKLVNDALGGQVFVTDPKEVAARLEEPKEMAADAAGHEHKGKGEGGGQFVKGEPQDAPDPLTAAKELHARQVDPSLTDKRLAAEAKRLTGAMSDKQVGEALAHFGYQTKLPAAAARARLETHLTATRAGKLRANDAGHYEPGWTAPALQAEVAAGEITSSAAVDRLARSFTEEMGRTHLATEAVRLGVPGGEEFATALAGRRGVGSAKGKELMTRVARATAAEMLGESAERAANMAADSSGHEHAPKGSPEGGRFTGKGEGGGEPKTGDATKDTPPSPHAAARSAFDALGIPHSHLTDEELHSKLTGALAPPKEKPKAAPTAHLDTEIATLRVVADRAKDETAVSDAEVESILTRLAKSYNAAELQHVAEELGGPRVRGKQNALDEIRGKMTERKRMLESIKMSEDEADFAADASGHEHKGAGPGGGQFAPKGGGGTAADKPGSKEPKAGKKTESGANKKETPKATVPAPVGDSKMADQARAVVGKIKPSKARAFTGEAAGGKIDSRLAGAIGEEILIQHLRSLGYSDAKQTSEFLSDTHNNLPIDLIHDHRLIEAKAGQASNPDGVWALKYDGRFTKEQEAKFARMTPEKVKAAKSKINAAKVAGIHARKAAFIERMSAELGFVEKAGMMMVIINPDTQTADLFELDGFHDRIPFKSEQAQKAYVGSVRYGN